MGADIKSLRIRIRSVDSTLHLTKAMGLVAASKIRRATLNMNRTKEYASALDDLVNTLIAAPECQRSPYMVPSGEGTRIIVIAGDRGLAGGYNANVFRLAAEEAGAEIIAIGKRACDRYGQPVNSSELFSGQDAWKLMDEQCRDFLEGKFGRLGILYTQYKSIMTQVATLLWVLPLEKKEQEGTRTNPIFEPDEQTVLSAAVPTYLTGVLTACLRESFASEVAARRMAMDSAGKNAQVMIDQLQLKYNRARQNAITQEITEIVAGSGL